MSDQIADRDAVWLTETFSFHRLVGDAQYAEILLTDALSTFGYSPADVPDDTDIQAILEVAADLFEDGKHVRREPHRPPAAIPIPDWSI